MCIRDSIITELEQRQKQDPRLSKIFDRLREQDDRITQFYCKHQQILFIKTQYKFNTWKIVIPRTIEKDIIMGYHVRYGHMGALKVVKASRSTYTSRMPTERCGTRLNIVTYANS